MAFYVVYLPYSTNLDMIKFKILGVLFLYSINSFAQTNISQNCKSDLEMIQKIVSDHHGKIDNYIYDKYPVNKINNIDYLNLLFKVENSFSNDNIETSGALVTSQIGRILSVKWPINQIENLWSVEGVDVIQLAQKINPSLIRARRDTRADSVNQGIGLSSPFTGKNVLIGVTDWGFDYSSPNFYDTLLQNTRILSAWDQFKTSGPHPTGFNYGTEYNTQAEFIAAGTDTANIYSYGTHGTHVAGIAGGSGAGTGHRGMAFESQFLMTTFLVDEGAVLDAWQWMHDKAQAEGKRLVINMSWGLYHTGAIDGTSLLSQALDNYSEQGVVFVTSAGNNGDEAFHIKYDFSSDTMRSWVNFFGGPVPNLWGQSIHAWGEPNESFEMKLKILDGPGNILGEAGWYSTALVTTYIDSFIVVGTDSIFYNLSADDAYPTNNRPQMRLRVKRPSGIYRVVIESTSATGTVHYWNVTELSSDVGNWGMPFATLGPDYSEGDALYSIGAPACTRTAISVAAHASEYTSLSGLIFGGTLADFSSIGPLIDESLKPDISAPGVGVTSSISSYTDNNFTPLTSVSFGGRTYPFANFSGTSMSSPAVAGIAALMLEANPNLSAMQVKQIILQTAREDNRTGDIGPMGSTEWGFGKINAYAAVKRAINTVGHLEVDQPLKWTMYPNPSNGFVNFKDLPEDVKAIQILNLNGQIVKEFTSAQEVNLGNVSSGLYVVRLILSVSAEQQVLVLE